MFAILSVGFVLGGPVGKADAETTVDVSLDYTIYASGLRVANGTVTLTLDPGAYAIGLAAEPRGVIAWLTRWQYGAKSTGVLEAGRTVPLAYETQHLRRNRDRKFRIAYDDEGPIQEVYEPPKVLRDPVPPEEKLGALDPLSATVALVRAATVEGQCPSDIPVYDGRRRFDVTFVEAEVVQVAGNRFSAFEGEAVRCRLQFNPIAGDFDEDDRSSFWYEEAIAERQIDMWLAPVLGEGSPPIPVKLQGLGRYGPFYIHLQGVTSGTPTPDDADIAGESAEG
ncbi:MAG: DUF3108 domain-containing protein [Pseudomonadota bacterium]